MTAMKLLFIKMNNDSKFQHFIESNYNSLYRRSIACNGSWGELEELAIIALKDYHYNVSNM